jgi:large subunit ribosomal protein LP0
MSGKGKGGKDAKGAKGGEAKTEEKKDAGKGGKDAGKGGKDAKGGKAEEKKEGGEEKKEGGKPGKEDKKGKGKKGKEKAADGAEGGAEKEKEDEEATRGPSKPQKEEEPEIPAGSRRRARKARYKEKLEGLLREYKNLLIVSVDNVGSNQMQKIRMAIRGLGTVLMGKNTIMRKVIREEGKTNPKLLALLPFVVGNIGFVFTNGDLNAVRKAITEHKVPAAARAGSTAPTDVFVPPGPTGMDPGQTAFFQALNIATKIQKGSIEIINTVHLIKAGEKVTSSAVALLSKLDLKPFFYGMIVNHVFEDGFVYQASVLDLTKEDLFAKFFRGVHRITALSLEIGYPTLVSLPQHFARAMEKLYALSLATEYEFEESKKLKDILANPAAFAAASAPATGGGGGGGGAAKKEEPKKEEPKEEEPEEEAFSAGGLFGDD